MIDLAKYSLILAVVLIWFAMIVMAYREQKRGN